MSTSESKTKAPATPRVRKGAKKPTTPKPKNATPNSKGSVNSSNSRSVAATPEQSGEIAATLQSMRTCETSKSTYASKITQAVEWFGANRPHCLGDDGKLVLPIPCKELLEFFGHLASAAYARLPLKAPSQITEEMPEPLSTSTVGGYRSAIVDLYTNANMVMDPETKLALTRALDGYDKSITELKRKGLMKMNEGKRPISGSGYNMLGEKFMKINVVRTEPNVVAGRGTTSIFSWAFFVIMLNLMSRADSVDNSTHRLER
jgi:hypothetical protein